VSCILDDYSAVDQFIDEVAVRRDAAELVKPPKRARVSVAFGKALVEACAAMLAPPMQPRLLMTTGEVAAWEAAVRAARAADLADQLGRVRPGEYIGTLFDIPLLVTRQVEDVVIE
jgi:hypothetical protein